MYAMQIQQFKIEHKLLNVNTTDDKNNKELTACGNFSSSNVHITIKVGTGDLRTQRPKIGQHLMEEQIIILT